MKVRKQLKALAVAAGACLSEGVADGAMASDYGALTIAVTF